MFGWKGVIRPSFRWRCARIEQWERIEQLIGERCEFTPCGHSYFALDPKELARLERYQREGTAGGLEIELLGANEVRRRFPYARAGCVRRDVVEARRHRQSASCNARGCACGARARRRHFSEHARGRAREAAGERFRVATDRDLVFEAPFVVNAAGAWGNEIAEQFGETSPMFPAAPPNFVTEPLPYFITSALQDAGGAVIIRQVERGNVIVGFYPRGPADRVRNRAPVPPAKALLGASGTWRAWCRCFAARRSIRVWSGIEGYLPDMLPVMGWSRTTKNLLHAFGFCGHGFQLSPGVGYTLAEMIDEGRPRIPIDAFAIDRFAGEVQPDAGTPDRRVRCGARFCRDAPATRGVATMKARRTQAYLLWRADRHPDARHQVRALQRRHRQRANLAVSGAIQDRARRGAEQGRRHAQQPRPVSAFSPTRRTN